MSAKNSSPNYLQNFIRSLFIHAATVRFPKTSSSMIYQFQILQNFTFHVATCWVKMTSIDYLPEVTKTLPVYDRVSLLFSQYLDRTLKSSYPSQNVITSPSGFQKHETHFPISVPPSCCHVSLERYSPHN